MSLTSPALAGGFFTTGATSVDDMQIGTISYKGLEHPWILVCRRIAGGDSILEPVAVDTDGRLYYLLPRVYTWSHYMCCYWCVMTQLCVHGRTHMCEGIACVGRGVVG